MDGDEFLDSLSPTRKQLADVIKVINNNPLIDTVKADIRNMLPRVYIALYSSENITGFGGCTITRSEYAQLKEKYSQSLRFHEQLT